MLPDFKIAFGGDFLGLRQVVARLRFVRVGNGRRADLEILLGRFELLGDGRLVGAHGRQVLDGVDDVEISLRDTQDQILPGLHEVRLGLRDLHFRLVVGNPVLPAE